MFNENEIILRVLVVKMTEIILVHEHEFYTKIEKNFFYFYYLKSDYLNDAKMILYFNIHVSFPGTHSMYFILSHPCVPTLMAMFHLTRNTRLYTVLSLSQGRSYKWVSKYLHNLPLTIEDGRYSSAIALALDPPTSSQWSSPVPLPSAMLLNVAPRLEPRNNLYLE